jgi:hypothetical protein
MHLHIYVPVSICTRKKDYLGDPGVDGRIMLRWTFRKWDVGIWSGSSWLRLGTGGGTCDSIKCREFLD